MSGGEFISLTEDEFDRLADFAAGVLSGRDEAEVADLVRADPRWGAAHAALAQADAAVRTDLHAAATPTAMPADVAARLDAAIAAAGTAVAAAGRGTAGSRVIPIDSRRRRRPPLGVQLAAAAAAVVAVVFGIASIPRSDSRSGTPASAPDLGTAGGGVGPAVPEAAGAAPVLQSGRDYQPDTLDQLSRSPYAASVPPAALNGSKSTAADQAVPAPNAFPRLSDRTALTACLAAIAQTHPGTVILVDYARFEGVPAVLVLVQEASTQTVVVVGDDCGAGGSDEKDSAVVG